MRDGWVLHGLDTPSKGWSGTLVPWINRLRGKPRQTAGTDRQVPSQTGHEEAAPQSGGGEVGFPGAPSTLAVSDRGDVLQRGRGRDPAHRDRAHQSGRRRQRDRGDSGAAGNPHRGREPQPVGGQHRRLRSAARRDDSPPRLREVGRFGGQADGRVRRSRVLPLLRRRALVDGDVAVTLRHLQESLGDPVLVDRRLRKHRHLHLLQVVVLEPVHQLQLERARGSQPAAAADR